MLRPQPIPPSPGQESVWDYPRPPRLEDTNKHIQIIFNGVAMDAVTDVTDRLSVL